MTIIINLNKLNNLHQITLVQGKAFLCLLEIDIQVYNTFFVKESLFFWKLVELIIVFLISFFQKVTLQISHSLANCIYLVLNTATIMQTITQTWRCFLLHLIKQNCLLKTFVRTLILMTLVSLYLFSLIQLIWNCIIFL